MQASSTPPAPADTAVLTQRGDNLRAGWNTHETQLSQANLTRFGKRLTYPVDGAIYAQPLFVPGLQVNGGSHNTVIVATEHDSVYAFDSDATGRVPAPLWQRSLLPEGAHPLSADKDVQCTSAIVPEIGITSTPVIDSATKTMYVVATFRDQHGITYRMHAIDIATGADRMPPVPIEASVNGTASPDGKVVFDPNVEQQRVGLLLLDGVVYAAFSSYCGHGAYQGWILGYSAKDLSRQVVYTDNPDEGSSGNRPGGGGIWQSETGLVEYQGSMYVLTGNGPVNLGDGGRNAGMSLLRLVRDGGTLKVADYFTPFHASCLNDHDQDLSSSAPLLMPDLGEIAFAAKEGRVYVTRIDHFGGFAWIDQPCGVEERTDVDHIVQELPPDTVEGGVWGALLRWHNNIYTAGVSDHLREWRLDNGKITPSGASAPEELTYPAGIPVGSSNADTPDSAVVWIVDNEDSGPALRAYDPDLHELFSSKELDGYLNFTVPTVTAGKVFVGGMKSLSVFGPLN